MLEHMGDESVCELLEVGLGMLARARLGEGLRNTAQSCVQAIVRTCFTRLRGLTPEDVERLLEESRASEKKETKENGVGRSEADGQHTISLDQLPDGDGDSYRSENDYSDWLNITVEDPTPPLFTPYGLPTVLELLRVLIALLNPSDQAHTDSMRLSALAILNTALEVGGESLGKWPELREGVRDEGCRYLFQVQTGRAFYP